MHHEMPNSDRESRDDQSPQTGQSVQSGQTSSDSQLSTQQPPNIQAEVSVISDKVVLSCSKMMLIIAKACSHKQLVERFIERHTVTQTVGGHRFMLLLRNDASYWLGDINRTTTCLI